MYMTERPFRALASLAVLVLVVGVAHALASPGSAQVQGELIRVDVDAKTLVVKTAEGTELELAYTDQTEATGAGEGVAGLATKAGVQVTVDYTEDKDVKTATRILVHAAH
jgi:hypothetical protein